MTTPLHDDDMAIVAPQLEELRMLERQHSRLHLEHAQAQRAFDEQNRALMNAIIETRTRLDNVLIGMRSRYPKDTVFDVDACAWVVPPSH